MEVDDKAVVPNAENKSAAEEFGYAAAVTEVAEKKVEISTEQPQTTQDIINDTIKSLEVDDKGKFIYPEDMDPMLRAAIGATKSFRDTQSSFTKNQQELKGSQAETLALKERLIRQENPLSGLSPEERTALNELKYTNPDEWHKRINVLEASSAQRVDEKFVEVRKEAEHKTAEQQRLGALELYNSTTENKLTQEMLLNDVPPRWIQDVGNGELTFEDFLIRANKLLYGKKVVKNPDTTGATNINSFTGGGKDAKVDEEGINYADITF